MLLLQLWDAVNDPVVGCLTDRAQTRWGKRRPFLLFATPFWALFFVLLWVVPATTEIGQFCYYLIIFVCYEAFSTGVSVPYGALTSDLTGDDYNEGPCVDKAGLTFVSWPSFYRECE